MQPVPGELLEAVAGTTPKERPAPTEHVRFNGQPASNVIYRARKYLAKIPPAISGQHGHDRTFHVACNLTHKFALSVDEALPIMQEWNEACQPPWSEKELLHKLEDAAKASGPREEFLQGSDRHRSDGRSSGNSGIEPACSSSPDRPAPWQPFPVHILPEPVQSLVNETATSLGVDRSYVVLPVLAALGAAIGNSARIKLSDDWSEPAVL